MNTIDREMLREVSGITETPEGAYSLRVNGKSEGRQSSQAVQIQSKEGSEGIDVIVAPGAKNALVHIPVVISESGLTDLVYNDFFIGAGSDVTIIAGCGIHNNASHLTQHDGIHTFHVEEGAWVRYVEKHYGNGEGTGAKVLNPVTVLHLGKGSEMEIETVQIEGVDDTKRTTTCDIQEGASLVIKEKLMTSGKQTAITEYEINLDGADARANLMSRSVAKGESMQGFYSVINGNNRCAGHSECDAIIMDHAVVKAVPDVTAKHVDAELIHEAAIGKIAGEQIVKLMTLGMTEDEAEQKIVDGFLR